MVGRTGCQPRTREASADELMKHFLTTLACSWLGVYTLVTAEIKCTEADAGPKAQLEYLQNERASLEGKCVVYAIGNIGFSGYLEGVKTLISYLDYGYPTDPKT